MKSIISALSMAAFITVAGVAPALSQVVINNDPYADPNSDDGETEYRFLRTWNHEHDTRNRWQERRTSFGPQDVIRLLEARGYSVRNVEDVGMRYLVQASRGGDDLLVSVSRSGDIMGVVHDRR
ncbi:hypothetical protein LAV84_27325 [Rhizobium sp. VS19-DR104.2]|uniref:hypothetical protein n=1 Tax=unclassified Rhizobium TaxID=2613769 RepID=UPI001C5B24CF|nr:MULTISPECIES: hypothetical protein [unclassified Rhizobium]MBZ5763275.1 hypothetical protein [Rhizobium sp. VS19-DR96]MBZ5769380.1 hypothetical protein [Rhizobium sp. VS19-DR129.2]MBZ5776914.1 hypothetical protein [Rhizobium sp. VS19-DRK62.2]MBZ5787854.1 hypothetical protein [Rhizobium sp. VS19-DR121]MBZ5805333.1 hypothetical protein [Rhizobium sp. VS19-DR181]